MLLLHQPERTFLLMKVNYDPKNLTLGFGKNNEYGKVQFQKGSLVKNKENGIADTDIIAGLEAYLQDMDERHASIYNKLAIGNLNSALVLLGIRRNLSHDKAKRKA